MTDLDNLSRLLAIMARLRDPERGCPWDREQNFASIAPYTIEEAYEVAEAIAQNDSSALRDELGDLLFQVVFHARMAEEAGLFDFDEVAKAIADKMVRRHPHVFGGAQIASAAAQSQAWEEHKEAERRAKAATGAPVSALDGVGLALPALTRAAKIQARAARVGFDWPTTAPVFDKIAEEIAELKAELAEDGGSARLEEETGDLLFAVANLARHLKIDPESALRKATSKFEKRFHRVEERLRDGGKAPGEATLDEMETEWQGAKAEGL
jgi:nucleoside triphosphate diphosphatase